MGLFSFLSGRGSATVEKSSAGAPVSGALPILGSTASVAGVQVSQVTAMEVSNVYAAVMQRAKDFARCTPRLFPVEDGRSGEPNKTHPLARILRRPNWVQTWFEFAVQMHVAFILRGNAYAVILRKPDGDPQYLIPVNPDNVLVLEASDGQVFYQVNRSGLFQLAVLRDLPVAIPAEDVLHIRSLSFNMLTGAPTIGLASNTIGIAMALVQQAGRWIAHGARPAGVLQSKKKLTPETAERLRRQWEDLKAGIQNVGKTAILEDEIEWKPMQLTSVDLQFIEQRRLAVEETTHWFGVPLYKLGNLGSLGSVKIDDAEQVYVNGTIMPDIEMWEQKLEMHFGLDDAGLEADFDERNLLRASESVRINNQRLRVMSALATPNECRREEGLPPKPGGDVLMFPVNLGALGSDISGSPADGAGRPDSGTLPDGGNGSKKPETD
ncbi:phage portal protein [Rhizobium oryzicola]|uniref:Phage portal protein n=1 Tax=Rhizobium oryzicola TaxID=1232668 RepID=A0ABT8SVH3_9HYPH|nr:phage portal protein [Rhizobium oryzicola]MDO1582420.1 phage portal protein [Rhizobium oryzicola]